MFVLFPKQCAHTDLTVGVKPAGSIRVLLVASGFRGRRLARKFPCEMSMECAFGQRRFAQSLRGLCSFRKVRFYRRAVLIFQAMYVLSRDILTSGTSFCVMQDIVITLFHPRGGRTVLARCLKCWQAWEIRGGSEVIFCGRRIIE